MAVSLLSLPPPLLATIVQFAVEGFTQDLSPFKRVLPLNCLRGVALVCKTTHEIVKKMTQPLQDQVFSLGLEDIVGPEDIEDITEEIKEYGASVLDFRLRLGPYEPSHGRHDPRYVHLQETEPGELDNLIIDWDTVFGYMPGLKRLDLTEVPLLSRHIPEILKAASKCCPNLEFLILPNNNDFFGIVSEVKMRNILTALVAALEMWYSTGNCGGLKQLTMPSCDDGNELRSIQYIEAVARFCPKLEYIDGYVQVLRVGKENARICGQFL